MEMLIEKIEEQINSIIPKRIDQRLTTGHQCIIKEYDNLKKEIRCYDSIETIDTHLYYTDEQPIVAILRTQMNQISGGFFSAQKQEDTRLYFENGQLNEVKIICNQYGKSIPWDRHLQKHWALLIVELLE
jgi:hypothetical protein